MHIQKTQTVAISELLSHLLAYLKKAEHAQELIIKSKGHEIARIIPPEDPRQKAREELQQLRNKSASIQVLIIIILSS